MLRTHRFFHFGLCHFHFLKLGSAMSIGGQADEQMMSISGRASGGNTGSAAR